MRDQLGLFDGKTPIDIQTRLPKAASEAIRDGMARADEHANEQWKAAVRAAIIEVARRLAYFTVDDVLDYLDVHPITEGTHTLSALGPLMKHAAHDGVITFSGRVQRSKRAVKHGITHRIWESKLYTRTHETLG